MYVKREFITKEFMKKHGFFPYVPTYEEDPENIRSYYQTNGGFSIKVDTYDGEISIDKLDKYGDGEYVDYIPLPMLPILLALYNEGAIKHD